MLGRWASEGCGKQACRVRVGVGVHLRDVAIAQSRHASDNEARGTRCSLSLSPMCEWHERRSSQ